MPVRIGPVATHHRAARIALPGERLAPASGQAAVRHERPSEPAADRVRVLLDGNELRLGTVQAHAESELLHIPARATFERMGAAGMWFPESQTFFVRLSDRKVWLTVGEPFIRVNRMPRELEATIRLDRKHGLMIPVGACKHAFDLRIVWAPDRRQVEMFTQQRAVPPATPVSMRMLSRDFA
jgi:hypothetical protein